MFEHVAAQRIVRVYEPPGWLDKTKVPRRGGKEGALFFGYFRLCKQKKVTCRRATPGNLGASECVNARPGTVYLF